MRHTKLTSLLLVLAMMITSMVLFVTPATAASNVWDGTAATAFAGGSGTEADPFKIATPHQLAYLASLTNAEELSGSYSSTSAGTAYRLVGAGNSGAFLNTYYISTYNGQDYLTSSETPSVSYKATSTAVTYYGYKIGGTYYYTHNSVPAAGASAQAYVLDSSTLTLTALEGVNLVRIKNAVSGNRDWYYLDNGSFDETVKDSATYTTGNTKYTGYTVSYTDQNGEAIVSTFLVGSKHFTSTSFYLLSMVADDVTYAWAKSAQTDRKTFRASRPSVSSVKDTYGNATVTYGASTIETRAYVSACYVITADLYLNKGLDDYLNWQETGTYSAKNPDGKHHVSSICSGSVGFFGTFDGAGHTVYGLYSNTNNVNGSSLFGKINGGTVKRVHVSNINLRCDTSYTGIAGGIVSYLETGLIEDCHVRLATISGRASVGGIAGQCGITDNAKDSIVVRGCTFDGVLESYGTHNDSYASGIVGCPSTHGVYLVVENCSVFGTITGSKGAAGIVCNRQSNFTFRIVNCTNYANVKCEGAIAAGMFPSRGDNYNGVSRESTIIDCANFGEISGGTIAAGAIGLLEGKSGNELIVNFYNAGTIKATAENGIAAGILGQVNNATRSIQIRNCVSVGSVSGTNAGTVIGSIIANMTGTKLENIYHTGTPMGAAASAYASLIVAENLLQTDADKTASLAVLNAYVATWNANANNAAQPLTAWSYDPTPTVAAASVTLGDALAINVYVKDGEKLYTNRQIAFKIDGEAVEGTADGDYVKYTLSDIKASELDKVYAITVEQAGKAIQAVNYSISTYIERMTGKGDAKLDAVLGALATYGAAAKGEDVDVDEAYGALNLAPVENVDGTYATAIALVLTDSVRPIVKVVDGVAQVKVEMYGQEHTYDVVDGEVIIDCVTATSLNNVMTLTFVDADGTELGSTDYAIANYVKQAEELDLAKALAVYMRAVRTY